MQKMNSQPEWKIPSEFVVPFDLFKIATNRDRWNLKTPLQKWCCLYGVGRLALIPTGYTIYKYDQTLPWRTIFPPMICMVHLLLSVYTVLHYSIKREFINCLPCTCLVGLTMSVIPFVFIVGSKERFRIKNMINFVASHVYADCERSEDLSRLCSEQIDSTIRIGMMKGLMMISAFFAAEIGSEYGLLVYGIKTTTTELHFPFIDEKSNTEFIANFISQCVIGGFGALAYTGIEVLMLIIDDFATILPKTTGYELGLLSSKIENGELTAQELQCTFKNILEYIFQTDDYIIQVRDVFRVRSLVLPLVYSYSIAMSIYCQYTMKFMAGYGFAAMSMVQLYFVCELGEHVEFDGFAETLYDFDWYTLPKNYQRSILFLIQRKQNGVKFSAGPYGDINLNFFAIVTKKIYSFVTFLLKFAS